MENKRYYEVVDRILTTMIPAQVQENQNRIDPFLEMCRKNDFWAIVDILRKKLEKRGICTIDKTAGEDKVQALFDVMHSTYYSENEISEILKLYDQYGSQYLDEQVSGKTTGKTNAEIHYRAFGSLRSQIFKTNYKQLEDDLDLELHSFNIEVPEFVSHMITRFVLLDLLAFPDIIFSNIHGGVYTSQEYKVSCTIHTGEKLSLDIYQNTSPNSIKMALRNDKKLGAFIEKYKAFTKLTAKPSIRQKPRYYDSLKVELESHKGKPVDKIYYESFDRKSRMPKQLLKCLEEEQIEKEDEKAIGSLKKLKQRRKNN